MGAKIKCPKCGHQEVIIDDYEIRVCKKCYHRWLKSKEKPEMTNAAWLYLYALALISVWMLLSLFVKWKMHLTVSESLVAGFFVFALITAIVEITIQSLRRRK